MSRTKEYFMSVEELISDLKLDRDAAIMRRDDAAHRRECIILHDSDYHTNPAWEQADDEVFAAEADIEYYGQEIRATACRLGLEWDAVA